jgi:hypothetical protein
VAYRLRILETVRVLVPRPSCAGGWLADGMSGKPSAAAVTAPAPAVVLRKLLRVRPRSASLLRIITRLLSFAKSLY